jgi:hypothetical protein
MNAIATLIQAETAATVTETVAPQAIVNNAALNPAAQALTNVRQYFERLVAEREAWESTVYRTSNDQLYSLLQQCYQTYKAMSADTVQAKALRDGLTDYVNTKGLKFNAGTHTIVKIVKCVFGIDRRRVSAYGIVLRTALANNVAASDIPDFIRKHGGVEEIRLAKSDKTMTVKQKAAVAADAVQAQQLGVFASDQLSGKLDAGNIGKPMVLIGTWQADGTVIVRTVVENDTAIKAALACHYSANKDTVNKQASEKQAANDEQLKQAAIDAAVQAAVVNG